MSVPLRGVMIADKVGEVHFVNMNNFREKGASVGCDDRQYKTLFGHQQECVGMKISMDENCLASFDTLNRIRISDFPNVFNIAYVILEHTR